MINAFISLQFIRFLAVGVTSSLCIIVVRIWLNTLMSFPLAVTIAYGIGMMVAFELNRRIVFPASTKSLDKQIRHFVTTYLGFFPIGFFSAIFIKNLLDNFNVTDYANEIAHCISVALPSFLTFIIYKFFVFKEK